VTAERGVRAQSKAIRVPRFCPAPQAITILGPHQQPGLSPDQRTGSSPDQHTDPEQHPSPDQRTGSSLDQRTDPAP